MTGIILAGGKNSRMGRDKAFIRFCGKPLIETTIAALSVLCRNLMIVTNSPYLYSKYKLDVFTDEIKNCGPLGGIYTGLLHSEDTYNFAVACDMPFINPSLISYMISQKDGYDVILPECDNRPQPLFAVYSRNCIGPIKRELSKKNLKLTEFLKHVKVRKITEEEIAALDPEKKSFININNPSDYRSIEGEARAAVS